VIPYKLSTEVAPNSHLIPKRRQKLADAWHVRYPCGKQAVLH